MRVLVLAPYLFDTAPGQRFRIEQWMPLLEREGVQFEFEAFESPRLNEVLYKPGEVLAKAGAVLRSYARRLAGVLRARRFDAVFLHREASLIGPAFIERLITSSGVPIVYEFDDAIYVPYVSPSNKYLSYLKFPQKTASICRLSKHVIVGNDVLRQYAARHNPNVTIVPTTIDTEKYQPICRYDGGSNGEVVIGWSGSYSSVQYLEPLKPVFTELSKKHRIRVEVIGSDKFELPGVPCRAQRWQAESEVQDLSQIQIGLMPLPDENWARGKCALKALQYMALGIPTIVSPVGVNKDVVVDGQNGLHASTPSEWVIQLSRLLEDVHLRRRLGEAGRRTVVSQYSAVVQAPRVLDVLRSATARA